MTFDPEEYDRFCKNMQKLNDWYPFEMQPVVDQLLMIDRTFFNSENGQKLVKIFESKGISIKSPTDINACIFHLLGHPIVSSSIKDGYSGVIGVCLLLYLDKENKTQDLEDIIEDLIKQSDNHKTLLNQHRISIRKYLNRMLKENPDSFSTTNENELFET